MAKRRTQKDVIKDHFMKVGEITPMTAFSWYGITRLSAIIFDLRKEGMIIHSRTETKKNQLGGYSTFSVYYINEVSSGD